MDAYVTRRFAPFRNLSDAAYSSPRQPFKLRGESMRNTVAAALLVLALATAAAAEETQRYLVATRQPFRDGALAAVLRDARQGVSPRDVTGFQSFDGFAADLKIGRASCRERVCCSGLAL